MFGELFDHIEEAKIKGLSPEEEKEWEMLLRKGEDELRDDVYKKHRALYDLITTTDVEELNIRGLRALSEFIFVTQMNGLGPWIEGVEKSENKNDYPIFAVKVLHSLSTDTANEVASIISKAVAKYSYGDYGGLKVLDRKLKSGLLNDVLDDILDILDIEVTDEYKEDEDED